MLVRAVSEDRSHRVHLRVARSCVATGGVDLLEDDARRRQTEPGAAVLLGDQRRQPAVLGQRRNELLWVSIGLEALSVLAGKAVAELSDRGADFLQLTGNHEVHRTRTLGTLQFVWLRKRWRCLRRVWLVDQERDHDVAPLANALAPFGCS
jgi:hypothetical protein